MHRVNRRRLATVLVAPVAALAAWGFLRAVGIDLVLKDGSTVGAGAVFAAALAGALAAWPVVRWLDLHSRRARAVWAFVGSTALSVSLLGPTWRADGGSAVALIGLHVVTAIVVIAGFAGTLPAVRRGATTQEPART
jgi:uncharacterized protein DUF6069